MIETLIPNLGERGLGAGMAAEDAPPETLSDMWNLRVDEFGRLRPRDGYQLFGGLVGATYNRAQVFLQMPTPDGPPEIFCVVYAATGTYWRFYKYNRSTLVWNEILIAFPVYESGFDDAVATYVYDAMAGFMGFFTAVKVQTYGLVEYNRIMKCYKSGASWRFAELGIINPPADAQFTQTGSGTWNGTYAFTVCFYNNATNSYSGKCAETSRAFTNQALAVTDIPTYPNTLAGDMGADMYRKIYVKKSTWSAPVLLASIQDNTTTTYASGNPPTETDTNDYPADWGAPPDTDSTKNVCVAEFLGRLWVAVDNNLYWSSASKPDHFPAANVLRMKGRIRSLVPQNRMLYVLEDSCIEVISVGGEVTATSLAAVEISGTGVAYSDRRSAVACFGAVLFRSGDDVVALGADGEKSIGDKAVRDLLRGSTGATYSCVEAAKRRYHLFTTIKQGSVPDASDSYNLHLIYDAARGIWLRDCEPGLCPTAAAELLISTTAVERLVLGGRFGRTAMAEYNAAAGDGNTTVQGTVTAATSTTLSDSSKNWTTNALAGMCVMAFNSASSTPWATAQFRPIISNTATQVTLGLPWQTTPSVGWLYVIGSVPWFFRTPFIFPREAMSLVLLRDVYLELAGGTWSTSKVFARMWRGIPTGGGSSETYISSYSIDSDNPRIHVAVDQLGQGAAVEFASVAGTLNWKMTQLNVVYERIKDGGGKE